MTVAVRLFRTLALPLALLGMMAFGGVQSIACDMHGLGAMRSGSAPVAASAPAHAATHASSHAASPSAARHEHRSSHDSGGDGECCCTCIGDCTAPAQAATVPVTPTLRVALVVAEPRRLSDEEPVQSALAEPDRLLPFANGPPTVG